MKVKELLNNLNEIAPFLLQESYDNSGLQFGDLEAEVSKILLALDLTEETVNEAKEFDTNVIITHHPVFFRPVKNIEKTESKSVYEAITNKLNVISFHTNFDMAEGGLNDFFVNLLGLKKIKPVIPSSEKIYKVITFVPEEYVEKVRAALFDSGAGHIGNYSECSFNTEGTGTFKPLKESHPFIGEKEERTYVKETKVEVIARERDLSQVLDSLRKAHPYEEPAIDVFETLFDKKYGIGAIGELKESMQLVDFIKFFKEKTNSKYVRLIGNIDKTISKVAVCTGACSSIFENLLGKVDLFITGDISYHTALAIKGRNLPTIDVEHFETEKFFKQALFEKLSKFVEPSSIMLSSKEESPFTLL